MACCLPGEGVRTKLISDGAKMVDEPLGEHERCSDHTRTPCRYVL
jgi:hypothetical protein